MKPYRFKFIDLFAGIGGFHQAMRYLGGECVMAAEINKECVETYKLNFKTDEKNIRGDVNKIEPDSIAPFDVLCAGFPCQPFSKAGYDFSVVVVVSEKPVFEIQTQRQILKIHG